MFTWRQNDLMEKLDRGLVTRHWQSIFLGVQRSGCCPLYLLITPLYGLHLLEITPERTKGEENSDLRRCGSGITSAKRSFSRVGLPLKVMVNGVVCYIRSAYAQRTWKLEQHALWSCTKAGEAMYKIN
ncbi:hypothetical protein SLE2022_116390 [Rubroshorea leprosula]